MKPDSLQQKVNAATDNEEAQKLANELQDLTLSEYWEYPLTYTNYVMVSQQKCNRSECSTDRTGNFRIT